jgi:antitoxin HigA-1
MSKKNTAQPANPFHPTQATFARKIGWTKARLNEFVRGKRGVTADAALDLGEALGISARYAGVKGSSPSPTTNNARFDAKGDEFRFVGGLLSASSVLRLQPSIQRFAAEYEQLSS